MESQRDAHARYTLLEAELLMSESESAPSPAPPLVLPVHTASVPVQVLPASRAPVRRAPAPCPLFVVVPFTAPDIVAMAFSRCCRIRG